jgi:hypothetical protein
MPAAPGETTAVVMDEPVLIRQGGLRHEWGEGIRQDCAVDEQHRLSRAPHVVLQLPIRDGNAIGEACHG